MTVQIALLNGLTCELPLLPSSTVQDLRAAAHEAFGQNYRKLVTADKRILVNPQETLEEAEIWVWWILATNWTCDIRDREDPTISTWSHSDEWLEWDHVLTVGSSLSRMSHVQLAARIHHTRGLIEIPQSSPGVVQNLADSSAVQNQLRDVQQIQATEGPSSRLLHLDVLGAPRALCWQKYRVRRGGKLTGHSLASCIKTCSAPSGSVLIAQGVN